jgi:biotin carboxylase
MSRASAPSISLRPVAKLMAANRSEIAVRIFRAGTELGLRVGGHCCVNDFGDVEDGAIVFWDWAVVR